MISFDDMIYENSLRYLSLFYVNINIVLYIYYHFSDMIRYSDTGIQSCLFFSSLHHCANLNATWDWVNHEHNILLHV